jgi:hypothetical protein
MFDVGNTERAKIARMRDVWIRRCDGFAEEAEADAQFWAAMTPDERVAVVEQMRSEWWSINGRCDEGLRRVVHIARDSRR